MIITQDLHYGFSGLFLLSAVLPFFKSDWWVIRVFDYPRLQKFILLLIMFVTWFFVFQKPAWYDFVVLFLLGFSIAYLTAVIYPYTILGRKMIEQSEPSGTEKPLQLLVCNVFQDNQDYARLVNLVNKKQPDVILLLETNKAWQEGISELRETYPYRIEAPLENTYGLLFYSRLPVIYHELNYLIDKEIPSVVADVEYNGQVVRLYGLHPTPPVPQENPESTERDAEILLIGKMAKAYDKPCIVFGDLNDVAWSYTTSLFLKASGLLDPRRGRGMYSTFHASHWLLRWPLDHYFLSGHFRLVNICIEESVGSDHFPISISLVLKNEDDSEKLDISHEEKMEVQEKIEAGIEKGDA